MFSDKEKAYIQSQSLARLATVSVQGQPDVAPVGYEFEDGAFVIGSLDMERTLKYKNIKRGHTKVALVIDDLESVVPWKPRGIKIHGTARLEPRPQSRFPGDHLRIVPEKIWSWGIEAPLFDRGQAVLHKKDGTSMETLKLGSK